MSNTETAHLEEQEALDTFARSVENNPGKSWLAVYVVIDDSGEMTLRATTWEFPTSRFLEVVNLLCEDLLDKRELADNRQKSVPKFKASHFEELQKLLAKRRNDSEESKSVDKIRPYDASSHKDAHIYDESEGLQEELQEPEEFSGD